MKRLNKIVTKVGDKGRTALVSGEMVKKSSLRVKTYGDIDELNSYLGVAMVNLQHPQLKEELITLQHRLFTLGADLSSPLSIAVPRIEAQHVQELEEWLEGHLQKLEALEEFILPGGGWAGAHLHVARCIARRAERLLVELSEHEDLNEQCQIYLNRLSDYLFVAARTANQQEQVLEVKAEFSQRKR